MNEWFIFKVTHFQGITEVQNKIQCSKRNKKSRVIQVKIIINMDNIGVGKIIHVQSKIKPANCKSIYRGCTNNTVPHL